MKTLVTGAAGFIGSNLAEKLCQEDMEVVGLDNFNDYYDPRRKRANQKRLSQYPNFKMIEADIRDRRSIMELFSKGKFDRVAHLAGMAGVRNAVEQPELYIDINVTGSQNLMDGARESGVKNFVFASTSTVYGNSKQFPLVESDHCDRPLQPYAASKRAIEILGYTYHFLFNLNFTVVRFFSVYGPYGRPDMMVFLVADSISKGKQINLHEGGMMSRAWTYVDDIVEGIIKALNKPCGYEIFNLGREEPVLLKDLVTLLENYAGKKANFIEVPKPKADINESYADINKARNMLGYEPQITIEEGLRRFWDWYINDIINH